MGGLFIEEKSLFVMSNGNTYLHEACIQGNDKLVTYMINRGYYLDSKNNRNETALNLACCYGFKTIVMKMLEAKCSINRCLEMAVKERQIEIVKLLVQECNEDPRQRDSNGIFLIEISKRNNTNIITNFLSRNISEREQTEKIKTETYNDEDSSYANDEEDEEEEEK